MKHNIYIPSRGRHDKCLTANLLKENDVPFYLVVEPQDVLKYAEKFDGNRILVLPENDRGLWYVRAWIKEFSKSQGEAYHWQVDDNIASFRRRLENKNVKSPVEPMLMEVEDEVGRYSNVGIAGLAHMMFAFAAKKDISINKQVYSCVLVNNETKAMWRPDVVDDTDYSLQVLSEGYCTMLFNRLIIDKPATMKMRGGCTEIDYGGDGRLNRSLGLQRNWPGWFEITEQYGRVKVKPSRIWKTFTQQLIETRE